MTFKEEMNKILIKNKSGYLNKFGSSLVIAVLVLLCFIFIFVYYYFSSLFNLHWDENRCNPKYMAFANFFGRKEGGKNFKNCVNTTLKSVAKTALSPITYAANGIIDVQKSNLNAINSIGNQVDYIRNRTTTTVKDIMHRLIGFLIPTQNIMLKIRDTFQRATSVMTASLYAFFGFLVTLKSSMGYIISTIITFLIALAASVTLQFAVPFNWKIAQMGLQFFLLLAVPAGIASHWLEQTFAITTEQTIPPNPRCFGKDTHIFTTKGEKKIINICVGDELIDGSVVTATFKLSNEGETIYNFNNIIVTGTHTVYHPIRGWILISEHEDSKKIEHYDDPFCYCINTSSKRIYIKNYSFLDWDDIKYTDFLNLKKQTGIKKMSDISSLDVGFSPAILLDLQYGKKKISDIVVGDILKNGEKVLGIVKTLGKFHLITNCKSFNLNNRTIPDYNNILEIYD